MSLPNYSGGTAYTANENDNISKIAGHVKADGSLIITDITPASASNSYAEIYLESGQLKFKYYDTNSTTLSGGTDYTDLSGADPAA